MNGNIDYLLRDVVTDSLTQDALLKGLIAAVDLNSGFPSFAMEAINGTTTLPLNEAN